MTDINISVYHILHFAHLIDHTFGSLERLLEIGVFDDQKNEDLRGMVQITAFNQILLYTTSLTDEYSTHFISKYAISNDEKGKVEQIRELLKPVFKKINGWKGIKDFRNNILAHNLRNPKSGNKSVFILNGISRYNIPERVRDFGFLIQCVDLIRQVIYKIFKDEYRMTVEEVNKMNAKTKNQIPLSNRDYEKEYKELQDEIWEIKEKIEARFS